MPTKLFGDPDGPKRGPGGKKKVVIVPPPDDGAPSHLQDMRYVYLNPEAADKTYGQKHQRAFLKKDPKGFTSQMSSLEREHRDRIEEALDREKQAIEASTVPPRDSEEEEEDIGTEKCVELVERLIGEMKA